MTTRAQDRRNRSSQITLLASIAAGAALLAVIASTAFGGSGLGNDGAVPPLALASPSAPAETPAPTPVVTPGPAVTPGPEDGGSDAMPVTVELANATGAEVHVDIADRSGLLVAARSGTPGDGMSVESYRLQVRNLDPTTLELTWVDFPIDNALALYIDKSERGLRLMLVQPEPTGTTDTMGFDRVLVL